MDRFLKRNGFKMIFFLLYYELQLKNQGRFYAYLLEKIDSLKVPFYSFHTGVKKPSKKAESSQKAASIWWPQHGSHHSGGDRKRGSDEKAGRDCTAWRQTY